MFYRNKCTVFNQMSLLVSRLFAHEALQYKPSFHCHHWIALYSSTSQAPNAWMNEKMRTKWPASTHCCRWWMLAAVALVIQAQWSDFLLVFHPPQAPCKFFSSSSSSLLCSPPSSFLSPHWIPDLFIHLPLTWPGKLDLPPHTLCWSVSHPLADCSIYFLVCLCMFVSVVLTLFGLFLLCLSLLFLLWILCPPWGLRTLSLSQWGSVRGSEGGSNWAWGWRGGSLSQWQREEHADRGSEGGDVADCPGPHAVRRIEAQQVSSEPARKVSFSLCNTTLLCFLFTSFYHSHRCD